MKKFVIILLLVLAACSTEQIKEQTCYPPYFEWKLGECCLDANNNAICDFDETIELVEETVPEQNPIPKFLEKAPSKYWFSTSDTGKVAVDGEKRHSFANLDDGITDIYWDKRKAWSLCDTQREILELGQNFEIKNAICNPNTLNIKELKEYSIPIGPIDWMKKYANEIPLRIENTIQTIGVKTISPVLHFKEKDGTITVLRFDYHFKVPIVIDQYEKNFRFKSTNYLFDTYFFLTDLDDNVDLPKEEKSDSLVKIYIEEIKLLLNDDVLIKGIVENKGSKYIPPQKIFIECYDKEGKMIGSKETVTFEGITAYKESEFKTYIPLSNRNLDYCKGELV